MTDHLEAAYDRLGGLHDHLSRREAALAADDLHAILSDILDHLEAARTPDVDWKAIAGSADAVIRAVLAEMGRGPEVDPVLAVRELMQAQTDASIRRGLDDAAAGRTEHLGRFTDDEPEPDYDPRPAGCCGTCPPILGGGYDCTCADNPRCDANHADRVDRYGTRWVWCGRCEGFRPYVHGVHESGYGRSAIEIDEHCGPLTFAPRPADTPTAAPQPEPDPLDESNHTDRYDRGGDRWAWCDKCDGFRMSARREAHGFGHGVHKFGYGWSAYGVNEAYGPLSFAQ